jgi:hypothetical protein
MLLFPGWLVSIVTFPGVIVHEAAHKFFCDVTDTPVYSVTYFRFGNPAGFVVHKEAETLKKSLLITIGPLIVNTVLCGIFTLPVAYPLFILGVSEPTIPQMVLAWIGYSIGMHAFPSDQDANNFKDHVKRTQKNRSVVYELASAFSGLIQVANILRIFWFDLFYAIFVSMGVALFALSFI